MQISISVITALYAIVLLEIVDGLIKTKWIKYIRLFLLGWVTTALGR